MADVQELWITYKETDDIDARNDLLVHYLPLVNYVAHKIAYSLPPHIDQNDLVSYGTFGLLDAISRFDLERGIKFETYAFNRIRGAIIDELRSADWVPRSVRSRARAIDKASQKLSGELMRQPTSTEIADELEITIDQYHTYTGQVAQSHVVGLYDTPRNQEVENIVVGDSIADPTKEIEGLSDIAGLRSVLAAGIKRMSERERIVTTLYYYEGLTLGEIGTVLGVTESRICQIHTKAITNLLEQHS